MKQECNHVLPNLLPTNQPCASCCPIISKPCFNFHPNLSTKTTKYMKTKSVQYFEKKERENTCMVTWKKSEKCKVEKGPFNDNFIAAHQSKNNAPKLSFVCCPEPLLQTLPYSPKTV